jgi:hypothetical protein
VQGSLSLFVLVLSFVFSIVTIATTSLFTFCEEFLTEAPTQKNSVALYCAALCCHAAGARTTMPHLFSLLRTESL